MSTNRNSRLSNADQDALEAARYLIEGAARLLCALEASPSQIHPRAVGLIADALDQADDHLERVGQPAGGPSPERTTK